MLARMGRGLLVGRGVRPMPLRFLWCIFACGGWSPRCVFGHGEALGVDAEMVGEAGELDDEVERACGVAALRVAVPEMKVEEVLDGAREDSVA